MEKAQVPGVRFDGRSRMQRGCGRRQEMARIPGPVPVVTRFAAS